MITVLLLLACRPEGDKVTETGADAPYLVDEDALDLPEPTFDEAGATAAVSEAFGALREITAEPIVAAYQEALAGADASCPTWFSDDAGYDYWYDDCTSSDGTVFSGYGALVNYDGVPDGGYNWAGEVVYAYGSITPRSGGALVMSGAAGLLHGESDAGVEAAWNVVDGSFTLEEDEDSWLGQGLEPSLQMQALSVGDLRAFIVVGTLAGLSTEIDAILADDMLIATEETGTPCALEPTGGLSMRGADGHWTDVVFDVPFDPATETFGEMDASECDGCGTAWFQGQDVGQACFDFSELLDWEGSPW